MTPEQAITEARAGNLRPAYLVLGEEAFLAEQVIDALMAAASAGGAAGFNVDKMHAAEVSAHAAVAAARTVPMMAKHRFVLLAGIERWESKSGGSSESFDVLADYVAEAVDSAVLVLRARKLNGSRRLVRAAKKGGFVVSCDPLAQRELPSWIVRAAKAKGHHLASAVAETLAELLGGELGPVVDALERLSLFVGEGEEITEEALAQLITRVRQETVWALVDALSARKLSRVLEVLADAGRGNDASLPLLGAVGWRVRQLLKFQGARQAGQAPPTAAKTAGVPPFKVREIERTVSKLERATLERWLMLIGEADLALKGSRRAGHEVLATTMIEMCRQ